MLTRAGEAGVDMFVKDEDHLTLSFQGHPEYEGDTLAREFRRDVARALQGAPRSAPAGQLLRAGDRARGCARMCAA